MRCTVSPVIEQFAGITGSNRAAKAAPLPTANVTFQSIMYSPASTSRSSTTEGLSSCAQAAALVNSATRTRSQRTKPLIGNLDTIRAGEHIVGALFARGDLIAAPVVRKRGAQGFEFGGLSIALF